LREEVVTQHIHTHPISDNDRSRATLHIPLPWGCALGKHEGTRQASALVREGVTYTTLEGKERYGMVWYGIVGFNVKYQATNYMQDRNCVIKHKELRHAGLNIMISIF